MQRPFLIRTTRLFVTGILAAAIGFSWSLATSASSTASRSSGAGSRIVGTGLHFTNPFLPAGVDSEFPSGGDVASDPDGFDLGDAIIGSQVVRYLTAVGGVGPYVFTSGNLAGTNPNLVLDNTGRLNGIVTAAAPSPVKFTATVRDTSGLSRTGRFRLNTAPAPQAFRFAQDTLSSAQIGADYITNVEALSATPETTTYSVVPGSVSLNGGSIADLESNGFTLFPDGTLAGRPLNSGTLNFTAQAIRNGVAALNRAGTAPNQAFSIAIAPVSTVQSIMATTNATLRIGGRARDTLNFQFFINADGLGPLDFAGQEFVLRFQGRVFKTTLNSRGQSPDKNFKILLTPLKGTLKVMIKNADFSKLFPTALVSGPRNVVIQLQIGSNFLATEPVRMNTKATFRQQILSYRLNKDTQIGGLFQVTSVKAADFSNGTAFKVNYLISAVVGSSNLTLGTPNTAVVHIGQGFNENVTLFRGKGRFFPPGVRSITITPSKKTGGLQTYGLTEAQTGIPPASQSGGNIQTFLLGLEVNTSTQNFYGEGSRRIFPFIRR